ncbi:MAG: ATP-binding protein, partial [Bacillota bacterium]|nr:ATP-binding protein [Bacillota bacterium]
MKHLKKMLLVNWHYFSHELIHFDNINFLTGQNASGKSTIIDAMQLLLLGETRSYFFNKAANEKSERTLLGYLKGELGDDGETGYNYIREGDFSTSLVMEFYDDVNDKSFVVGAVFDIFDKNYKYNYFTANGPMPKHHYIVKDVPMNRHDLRSYLKKHCGSGLNWCETNKAYKNILMGKFGNIKQNKFFNLIKKAVPFTPITDIETFITEYMTDVKNNIDMTYIQDNLRNYKRLEKDAESIKIRLMKLDSINQSYEKTIRYKETIHLHDYLIQKGSFDYEQTELEILEKNLENLIEEIDIKENELKDFDDKLIVLNNEKEKLISEKAASDIQKMYDQLNKSIENLDSRHVELLSSLQDAVMQLIEISKNTLLLIEKYDGNKHDLQVIESMLQEIISIQINDVMNFMKFDFQGLVERLNEVIESAKEQSYSLKEQLEDHKRRKSDLNEQLSNLRSGIKSYDSKLMDLKDLIESRLNTKAYIVADLLEINDMRWKKVIEGYLHTQKFNIIVEPAYFNDALKLYDDTKKQLELFNIGLVDIEKIMNLKHHANHGSLAEEI